MGVQVSSSALLDKRLSLYRRNDDRAIFFDKNLVFCGLAFSGSGDIIVHMEA